MGNPKQYVVLRNKNQFFALISRAGKTRCGNSLTPTLKIINSKIEKENNFSFKRKKRR
jgi:hypothetical protein